MYSSLHLIRKDFVLTRNFLLMLIPYYMLMGYTNAESYTLFSLFPAVLLLINSCSIDMQHYNQRFLVSLPVPRHRLVLAKYLTLIPFIMFSLSCTLLLFLLSQAMGRLDGPIHWRELGLATAAFPLLASIYLPLYYWLGQKGMQFVNIAFMLLVMLNVTAMSEITERFPGLMNWINHSKVDHILQPVLAGLAFIIIIYSSYLISVRIFNKKDI